MPDSETWTPTRAEFHNGRWRASRNQAQVSQASRVIADAVIVVYARMLRAHARGVLVDLGCGKAPYFGIYRDLVTKSVGVDWNTSVQENNQVDISCDLNKGIALPDAFADSLLCSDVLEHIFEPHRTWSEIARVLKPGGKAIVGVPFLYWIHEAPHDYHRYTSFALRRYAAAAGLNVEALEAVGGLQHVFADLICKSVPSRLKSLAANACSTALGLLAKKRTPADTPFPLHYVMVVVKPG